MNKHTHELRKYVFLIFGLVYQITYITGFYFTKNRSMCMFTCRIYDSCKSMFACILQAL